MKTGHASGIERINTREIWDIELRVGTYILDGSIVWNSAVTNETGIVSSCIELSE